MKKHKVEVIGKITTKTHPIYMAKHIEHITNPLI